MVDLAQPRVRAGPEAAAVKAALLCAGRASPTVSGRRRLSNGSVWEPFVGSDAESCREIGDEHLTLINAFYCQTSHKPHKSL